MSRIQLYVLTVTIIKNSQINIAISILIITNVYFINNNVLKWKHFTDQFSE